MLKLWSVGLFNLAVGRLKKKMKEKMEKIDFCI